MNNISEKLLKLLEKNARLTNGQLAAMLGVNEDAVACEISSLEKQGVLNGYKAIINWDKVKTDKVSSLIQLRVTPEKDNGFDETAKRIMQFEEVESVYLMSGGHDLLVEITGTSFQEIAMFVIKRLSTMENVVETNTCFLLTRYKESGIVFDNSDEEDKRSLLL